MPVVLAPFNTNLKHSEIFHPVYIERLPNKFISLFMHGTLLKDLLALRFFEAGLLD